MEENSDLKFGKKVGGGFATRSLIDESLDSKEHKSLKNQFSFENLNQDTFREVAANIGSNKLKVKFGKSLENLSDEMEDSGSQLNKDFAWNRKLEEQFRMKRRATAYLLTSESWL